MKLAFCFYKYFPYGGLQRDVVRIAQDCQARGHEIRVYTLVWDGDIPEGFEVILVPVDALTNYTRYKRFSAWVQAALVNDPVDCVVGINKMPGLDVYYAADSCYEEKAQTQRGWLYRQLPRYRHFAEYEKAVFSPESRTEILMISNAQKPYFIKHYQTPEDRMHFLPPGISRDRIAPENAEEIRQRVREEFQIRDDENLLLMVGSGFIKKGLSRTLLALRSLPPEVRTKTSLFVIGEDSQASFKRMTWALGIRKQVKFLAGRSDVPDFLLAADLLMHPASDENAGMVLLEAIVAGLPVLATDICGYGHYVEEADVGCLIPSPFVQEDLNEKLLNMLSHKERDKWQANGRRFATSANIYSLPQEASRIIERVTINNAGRGVSRGVLAFCLFKYFPSGGLQSDFIRIAKRCQEKGYGIRVYTLSWEGEVPRNFDVILVPAAATTNHTRYEKFSRWVNEHLQHLPVNGVVGFNKMPGLDVYFAADACYEEKAQTERGHLYRNTPRYKHLSSFEKAVFDPQGKTEILMISEVQKSLFLKYYETPESRFHSIPPGISREAIAPSNAAEIRQGLRHEFGIAEDELLLLFVGSGFASKGLDRILIGMNHLPDAVRTRTRLIAISQENPLGFIRMAERLGLKDQVRLLRSRDDLSRFFFGADLLVHPAYLENTGSAILKAIVAGLPVLATDVCGYAKYVTEAQAGKLVTSPYSQSEFDCCLSEMLQSDERQTWSENGIKYSGYADIYSMPERAADIIAEVIG